MLSIRNIRIVEIKIAGHMDPSTMVTKPHDKIDDIKRNTAHENLPQTTKVNPQ